mgnify:CR=1 FL=1
MNASHFASNLRREFYICPRSALSPSVGKRKAWAGDCHGEGRTGLLLSAQASRSHLSFYLILYIRFVVSFTGILILRNIRKGRRGESSTFMDRVQSVQYSVFHAWTQQNQITLLNLNSLISNLSFWNSRSFSTLTLTLHFNCLLYTRTHNELSSHIFMVNWKS